MKPLQPAYWRHPMSSAVPHQAASAAKSIKNRGFPCTK